MTERELAEALRDQVLKTWTPPITGMGCIATVAQTAVMQTLAFVFGAEFFDNLTFEQHTAIESSLKIMNKTLIPDSPPAPQS